MNKTALTAATSLLLLAACDDGDHAHGHDHAEEHAEPTPAAPAPAPAKAAASAPVELTVGELVLRLQPGADTLRLAVSQADGAAVTPAGEARVVLTGTGEAEQRIVLQPDESGWTGTARAAGAPGYIAVVSFSHDGQDQTARLTWGDVPAPAPAPEPAPAKEDAGDQGHDHGHGHGHGH